MINHAPLVKVHVHEHTGTVILNRPAKRNALTRELIAQLIQALDDLRRERRVRAVVLSGSGSAFLRRNGFERNAGNGQRCQCPGAVA